MYRIRNIYNGDYSDIFATLFEAEEFFAEFIKNVEKRYRQDFFIIEENEQGEYIRIFSR